MTNDNSTLEEMTRTAALALAFGEVERATQHPDGRRETDTTHTVMLQLTAMQLLLHRSPVALDPAKVLGFAVVHDLPETDPGDTNTMRALGAEARAVKDAGEAVCLERIRGELPLIAEAIDAYERQDTPEARFVRYLDKILPKLTHLLNGCATCKLGGMTLDELRREHRKQGEKLRKRYPEFISLHQLFAEACAASEAAWVAIPAEPKPALQDRAGIS